MTYLTRTSEVLQLSEATRNALRVSYAQYLRFIAENHAALLIKPPEARLDRQLIAEYVGLLQTDQSGHKHRN